jgi:hypothetical protein
MYQKSNWVLKYEEFLQENKKYYCEFTNKIIYKLTLISTQKPSVYLFISERKKSKHEMFHHRSRDVFVKRQDLSVNGRFYSVEDVV